MIKSDTTGTNGFKDLDGKKVATQQGSTAADRITQVAPGAEVSLFPDDAQCLAALKTNRVDAYVIGQGILISNASADDTLKVGGSVPRRLLRSPHHLRDDQLRPHPARGGVGDPDRPGRIRSRH